MFRSLLLIFTVFCTHCGQFGSQNLPPNETPKLNPIEMVTFCTLLDHPNDFAGKEIQTTAVLVTGFESAFIYDPQCVDPKKSVWFEIDSEIANEKLIPYMERETPEFKTTGLERVRGNFVGTFQVKKERGFGHMNLSEFNFVIRSADELSAVPPDTAFPW